MKNKDHYLDFRVCYNNTISEGILTYWTTEKRKAQVIINPEILGTRLEKTAALAKAMIDLSEQTLTTTYAYTCYYDGETHCDGICQPDRIVELIPIVYTPSPFSKN